MEAPENDGDDVFIINHQAKDQSTSLKDLEKGKTQPDTRSVSEKEGEFEIVGWDEGEAAK